MDIQHIDYDQLIAFALDELDANEARVVSMHTAFCAECSQTVTRIQSIRRWMRANDLVEPPATVIERAYAIFPSAVVPSQHVPDLLLVGFATDSLEPEFAKILATHHINSCPECSETVAHFRSIRAWFVQDDSQDPPLATLTRAYPILHNQRRRSMPWWQWIPSLITFPSARRLAMAVVLVLFILSTVLAYTTLGNMVPAAAAAIPGDSLYQIKRVFERMELATTWDTARKLDKHIAYAGYRVDETAALINIQRNVEIPATLAAFENETDLVVETYNALAKEDVSRARVLGPNVQDALAGYSGKLANLRDAAGDVITPLIDHAIATADSNQQIVRDVANQLLTQPQAPLLATLTPTSVVRPATRVVPSLTSLPRANVTTTPTLPLQNTPVNIAPTNTPVVVETATPTVSVPTATRTPTPLVPTATQTPTPMVPTATQTPPVLSPTATQTLPVVASTATQTPPLLSPTTTQTPPLLSPTTTQTPPLLAPTATQTPPLLAPTATQTPPLLAPTATQTPIPPVPTTSGIITTTP